MTENNKRRSSSGRSTREKTSKQDDSRLKMVPLFSRRSIIILGSGLIIGILLAFGYWLISPLFTSGDATTEQPDTDGQGLMGILGIEPGGPYSSTVSVQIVNPGSTYLPLNSLQQLGEYYAAKANSLPFLEFLGEELQKYPLETEYTVDDLDVIIRTEYDYKGELPTIKVTATAESKDEAAFFASIVPQAFLDYLIAEEKEKRDKEYEDTLEEIELVKEALYETELELLALRNDAIFENPTYIALNSRVASLQQEFDNQLSLIALEFLDETDLQTEYENTLNEIADVVVRLSEAELELIAAGGQQTDNSPDDVTLIILEAKIQGLTNQLNTLITGNAQTIGLTQLIASGTSSGLEYDSIMVQIELTAEALAEAQQEYEDLIGASEQSTEVLSLEYRLAQIKVDTLNSELAALQDRLTTLYSSIINRESGEESPEEKLNAISLALTEAKKELEVLENQLGYDSLSTEMETNIIEDKIATYNGRLDELTNQLSNLVGNNIETLETGYLVAGAPSIPNAVLPPRAQAKNTILMGAVLGIIVAWVILNFKWLKYSVSPSGDVKLQDDED